MPSDQPKPNRRPYLLRIRSDKSAANISHNTSYGNEVIRQDAEHPRGTERRRLQAFHIRNLRFQFKPDIYACLFVPFYAELTKLST
jgi:hypothetical protein